MMNEKALAEQFWEQGYIVLPNYFDEKLMDQYNRIILDHFGDDPGYFHDDEFLNKSKTEVIPWFPQQQGIDTFDAVENDPGLKALSEAIMGKDWYSLYCMAMFSRKGSKGQAWHQDCPPDKAKIFNLNRLIYTHDITDASGGQLLVVPGSHRRGELTVGKVDEDFPDQRVLTPKKGDLVLIHGHCWHRVAPVTGRYRVSINYRSAAEHTPEDVTDVCVYRNMRYRFSTNTVIEERS
ncbi:MAG: phytanoyl-CoA dioxygenase family protein [Halioglobus sp.]